jgi:hypothetical protein
MKPGKKHIRSSKLGVEAHDPAVRPHVLDENFAQSRDIHEDRGAIQSHLGKRQKGLRVRPKRKG